MTDASGRTVPRFVLAGDIGATRMRAAVVDMHAGEVVRRDETPTLPGEGFDAAADRLADLLARVRGMGWSALGVGISSAGPLDPWTGEYRHPPNLPGWHGRSMRDALGARFGDHVRVGHDATLAALAEARFGPHRGARDLVYLTVSSGIGAGLVSNGQPVLGHRGGAGEAGHLIVDPGGRACGAGCPGCLEGQASGIAIAAIGSEWLGRPVTAREVFELARDGNSEARAAIEEVLRHLGAGIAGLLALLDPEVVILGGGVSQGLEGHWDTLIAQVRRQALPRYADRVPVELTTLGDDASLLGAAVWAYEAPLTPGS